MQLFLRLLIFPASQVVEAAFGSPVGTDDMAGYVPEGADFNVDTFCDEGLGSCNV